MFEDDEARLFAMTFRAAFVEPRHGQAAFGLHNVRAVRIVALDAIHFVFEDGMVLRQFEFSVDIEMAFETGIGFRAGVDDEFAAATTGFHVQAARTMTRFARDALGRAGGIFLHQVRMSGIVKTTGDIRVALGARL